MQQQFNGMRPLFCLGLTHARTDAVGSERVHISFLRLGLVAGMGLPTSLLSSVVDAFGASRKKTSQVFSGLCFFGEHVAKLVDTPQCRELKVFWGHGNRDKVLHPSLQDMGVEALRRAGVSVVATSLSQQVVYPGTLP